MGELRKLRPPGERFFKEGAMWLMAFPSPSPTPGAHRGNLWVEQPKLLAFNGRACLFARFASRDCFTGFIIL